MQLLQNVTLKCFEKSKQNLYVYFLIMLYFRIIMGGQLWISTRLGNSQIWCLRAALCRLLEDNPSLNLITLRR